MKDVGSGWLKALEVHGRTAFLAFMAAALISAGHQQAWLSLAKLPAWAAAAANVCAILFGVLSLPWLLELLLWPVRRIGAVLRRNQRVAEALQALSPEEAYVFWSMVADGRRVEFGDITSLRPDVAQQGLVNRGLLQPRAAVGRGHSLWMPDHVWALVRNEPPEAIRTELAALEAAAAQRGFTLPYAGHRDA